MFKGNVSGKKLLSLYYMENKKRENGLSGNSFINLLVVVIHISATGG